MNVSFVSVPSVCADDVGDDKAEDSIEEEEEEDDNDDYDDEFEEEDPVKQSISKVRTIFGNWECCYQLKPWVDNPLGPPKLRFTIFQNLRGLKIL